MNLAIRRNMSEPAVYAIGIALALALLNALRAARGDLRKFVLAVAMVIPVAVVLPATTTMANINLAASPAAGDPNQLDDIYKYHLSAPPAAESDKGATTSIASTADSYKNLPQLYLALAIEAPRTTLVVTLVAALWLPLSAAAAMFASARRNRNPVGWFTAAVLLSPPMAFLMLAILRPPPIVAPATLRPARPEALDLQATTEQAVEQAVGELKRIEAANSHSLPFEMPPTAWQSDQWRSLGLTERQFARSLPHSRKTLGLGFQSAFSDLEKLGGRRLAKGR